MSKRATKPAAAARSRSQTTRANSRSPARVVDPDDDDDDDVNAASPDEELELFLRRPPLTADRVLVVAVSHTGDVVVQNRSALEAKRAPLQLATSISNACAQWALAEGRVTKFRATWMHEENVLAAHQWQAGEGRDPTKLDGTVESFLMQQQRASDAKDRLNLEAHQMLQEGWRTLLQLAQKHIQAQAEEIANLRERLRKADDVGSEIALETARADLAARGRTADLLEKRVLPLAQVYVAKQLEEAAAAAAAAAPAANGGG